MNKDDEARTEILKAAQRAFRKWGLRKTTMEDIAREARKGKSTLYYYYRSKEDIFFEVARLEIARILTLAREAVARVDTPSEKFRMYVFTALSEMRTLMTLYSIVRGEIRGDPELLARLRREYDSDEASIIEGILVEGIRSGEFRPADEREIAVTARAVVIMLRSLQISLLIETDDAESIDVITGIMMKGLSGGTPAPSPGEAPSGLSAR